MTARGAGAAAGPPGETGAPAAPARESGAPTVTAPASGTAAARRPTVWSRLRRPLGFAVLLLPWLVARFVVVAGDYRIGVFYDTFSYAHRGDPFYDRGALVSFTGHAPRLWGAPLFFAMFSDDTQRVQAQWAVSTLAFGLLAWALWRHLRAVVVRVPVVAAVLVLALLRPVTSWDFAVLAESLSISLGVLTVAALLLWLPRGSWWGWSVMVVAALWWLFVRAELRLAVGALAAALLLFAVLRRSRGRRRRQSLAAALVLLAGIGWVQAITPTVDRTFQRWGYSGLEQKEEMFILRLQYRVLLSPEMYLAYQKMGMPECPELGRHLGQGERRRRAFLEAYLGCPDLRRWGTGHGNAATVGYVLREPEAFARRFQVNSRQLVAVTPVTYAAAPGVLPTGVEDFFFPPQEGGQIIIVFWGGLLLAVVLALAAGGVRRRPALVWTASGTAAVAVGLLVFTDMFSSTELVRYGCQESILVKLASVALIGAGLDTLVERWGPRRAPGAGSAADADPDAVPAGSAADPDPDAVPAGPAADPDTPVDATTDSGTAGASQAASTVRAG